MKDALYSLQTELVCCASAREVQQTMSRDSDCLIILDTSALTTEQVLEVVSCMRPETYTPIIILAPAEVAQLLEAGADVCLQANAPSEIDIPALSEPVIAETTYGRRKTA